MYTHARTLSVNSYRSCFKEKRKHLKRFSYTAEQDVILFEWCKGNTIASIARQLQIPSSIVLKKMDRLNGLF
ncbi:MAG: hypothetical protein PQJ47_08370 [Sphaerochaetaceae bacterium]|nr:hypothetical protein [Sphaerochaetaceae bacterium]